MKNNLRLELLAEIVGDSYQIAHRVAEWVLRLLILFLVDAKDLFEQNALARKNMDLQRVLGSDKRSVPSDLKVVFRDAVLKNLHFPRLF